MDTEKAIEIIFRAEIAVRDHGSMHLPLDLSLLRDHYRKLAEREKALTEALGDAIDYVTDSTLFYKSVAALALHKEDA